MALIKQQLDLLDRLKLEMETGEIPSQAGLLSADGTVISHYTDRNSNDTITISDDSFLRRIDRGHGGVPKIHTRLAMEETPARTRGLDSIIEQLGLGSDTIRGVLQFDIQTSYAQEDAPVIRGIMINPLESVGSRKVRDIKESDPETLNSMIERYQAEFAIIDSIIAESNLGLLSTIFGSSKGFLETPTLPGFKAASYLQQHQGTFGGDIVHSSVASDNSSATYGNGDVAGHNYEAHGLTQNFGVALKTMLLDPKKRRGIPNWLNNYLFRPSTGQMLNNLNRLAPEVKNSLDQHKFITFSLANFQPNGKFRYSGAGDSSYILRADGSYSEIEGNGLPLGITNEGYSHSNHRLMPGDIYVNCSDGFTEAGARGGLFGIDNVMKALNSGITLKDKINRAVRGIDEHVRRLGTSVTDDTSITLVGYDPRDVYWKGYN